MDYSQWTNSNGFYAQPQQLPYAYSEYDILDQNPQMRMQYQTGYPSPESPSPLPLQHCDHRPQDFNPCVGFYDEALPSGLPQSSSPLYSGALVTPRGRSRKHSPVSDASSHLGENERFFHCQGPGCTYKSKRKADVNRHITNVHLNDPQFPCMVPGCARVGKNGFKQEYHRNEHMVKSHSYEKPPPKRRRSKNQIHAGEGMPTSSGQRVVARYAMVQVPMPIDMGLGR